MSIYSDIEVADFALTVEHILGIDMDLEEMFSDDLNQYFDYKIDEDNIIFYFETNEGSCQLVWNWKTQQIHNFNTPRRWLS